VLLAEDEGVLLAEDEGVGPSTNSEAELEGVPVGGTKGLLEGVEEADATPDTEIEEEGEPEAGM
jgi:hypothetical protein